MLSSRSDEAFSLLVREARRARPHDPGRAAQMLCDAGLTRAMAGRCHDSLRCMQEAASYLPAGRPPQLLGSFAAALTLSGRGREARPLFARIETYLEAVEPLSPEGQTVVLSLTPRTWLGDFEAADRLVARWVDRAREAGCLAYIGFPQALGAEVDLRRGRWGDALARAQEAVRSLEETGQTSQLSFALVTLAQVEAGLGREEDCRAHADRAMEIAAELGLGSIPVYRGFALALLDQGLGRPEAVVELLEPIADYAAESGLGEPATVLWQPELVEAAIRAGADRGGPAGPRGPRRAGRAHGRALGPCRDRPLPWPARRRLRPPLHRGAAPARAAADALRAGAHRARVRVAPAPGRAAGGGAGAAPARPPRLRGAGRRALGPPGARGDRGDGRRPAPPRARPPADELSPRERQVATATAEGLTNREVAARLFLSEKTVERHLGSVYGKLGLRSRTELARRFAQGAPPGGQPE